LRRKTYAVFAETRVPLLAQPDSRKGERLALTLAGRYDHSDDFGGKATWQSGLLWRATDTLSFSSSYGVSYRAPTLPELANPQTSFSGSIGSVDPFRGNQPVSPTVTLVYGPNRNLSPETGNALTFNLTYSSQGLHALRASLTIMTSRFLTTFRPTCSKISSTFLVCSRSSRPSTGDVAGSATRFPGADRAD